MIYDKLTLTGMPPVVNRAEQNVKLLYEYFKVALKYHILACDF